jgi:hypothetical protein
MKGLPFSPFTPKSEGWCALGMGDCGAKAESKSTIDIETLNKSVSNFLSSKAASATASAVNINSMSLDFGELSGNCDIDATQSITSSVKALTSLDSVSTSELQNTIKTAADAQIDQAAQAKSGFFATAASDAKTVSDYKKKVSNIVETNITDTSKAEAMASVYNKNDKSIKIKSCSDNVKIKASQNIVSDLVAQSLLKSVSSSLQTLDATDTTSVGVSQAATAKSGGLEDVISAIFAGLAGMYGVVALIVICCCCICCCGLIGVVAMGSGGGGEIPNIPTPPVMPGGVTLSAAPPIGA